MFTIQKLICLVTWSQQYRLSIIFPTSAVPLPVHAASSLKLQSQNFLPHLLKIHIQIISCPEVHNTVYNLLPLQLPKKFPVKIYFILCIRSLKRVCIMFLLLVLNHKNIYNSLLLKLLSVQLASVYAFPIQLQAFFQAAFCKQKYSTYFSTIRADDLLAKTLDQNSQQLIFLAFAMSISE